MRSTRNSISLVISGSHDEIAKIRRMVDKLTSSSKEVKVVVMAPRDPWGIELCIPPACYKGREVIIVLEHIIKRASSNLK